MKVPSTPLQQQLLLLLVVVVVCWLVPAGGLVTRARLQQAPLLNHRLLVSTSLPPSRVTCAALCLRQRPSCEAVIWLPSGPPDPAKPLCRLYGSTETGGAITPPSEGLVIEHEQPTIETTTSVTTETREPATTASEPAMTTMETTEVTTELRTSATDSASATTEPRTNTERETTTTVPATITNEPETTTTQPEITTTELATITTEPATTTDQKSVSTESSTTTEPETTTREPAKITTRPIITINEVATTIKEPTPMQTTTVPPTSQNQLQWYEGNYYYFSTELVRADQADQSCKEIYAQARILSISSDSENDYIRDNINSNTIIGLARDSAAGNWYWVDGESATYRNFKSGEEANADPQKLFVYMLPDSGEFVAAAAGDRMYFVCKSEGSAPESFAGSSSGTSYSETSYSGTGHTHYNG